MVQSLLTSMALRLSRKSSDGLIQNPLSNDFMFLPMAIWVRLNKDWDFFYLRWSVHVIGQ
jgi:hypothetical protein